jgi:hypothetical protein
LKVTREEAEKGSLFAVVVCRSRFLRFVSSRLRNGECVGVVVSLFEGSVATLAVVLSSFSFPLSFLRLTLLASLALQLLRDAQQLHLSSPTTPPLASPSYHSTRLSPSVSSLASMAKIPLLAPPRPRFPTKFDGEEQEQENSLAGEAVDWPGEAGGTRERQEESGAAGVQHTVWGIKTDREEHVQRLGTSDYPCPSFQSIELTLRSCRIETLSPSLVSPTPAPTSPCAFRLGVRFSSDERSRRREYQR